MKNYAEMEAILEKIAEYFNAGARCVYADALWPYDDEKTLREWINDTLNGKMEVTKK